MKVFLHSVCNIANKEYHTVKTRLLTNVNKIKVLPMKTL